MGPVSAAVDGEPSRPLARCEAAPSWAVSPAGGASAASGPSDGLPEADASADPFVEPAGSADAPPPWEAFEPAVTTTPLVSSQKST